MQVSTKEKFINIAKGGEIVLIEGICGNYMVSDIETSQEYLSKTVKINFSLLALGAKGGGQGKQQPSVPIQFVMVEKVLYPFEEFNAITSKIENCTVEQIGAVLYVRGE